MNCRVIRTGTPGQQAALAIALRDAYLEVFPSGSIIERLSVAGPGATLAVTCSPTRGVDETLEITTILAQRGYQVIPHLAARAVRDRQHLRELVARLNDLPVNSVFVPGGDANEPLGEFATAFELLRELAGLDHRFTEIGVAAHPEGHPKVDKETLFRELEKKQSLATYLVTQMCFDVEVLTAWLYAIRERGIHLPAWLGIPGVSERTALLKTSLRIGVGDSLRFLKSRADVAAQLLRVKTYTPDELLSGLASLLVDRQANIGGFHVFCFNQVEAFEDWRRQTLASLQAKD